MPDPTMLEVWAQHLQQAQNGLTTLINANAMHLNDFARSGVSSTDVVEQVQGGRWGETLDYGDALVRDAMAELQRLKAVTGQGAMESILEDAGRWPLNPYDAEEVIDAARTTGQAIEGVVAPAVEAVAPAVEAVAPAVEALAPTVDALAPTVDALAPTVDALAPTVEATLPTIEAAVPEVITSIEAAAPQVAATVEQNAPSIVPVVVATVGTAVMNPAKARIAGPVILTVILAIPVVLGTWWLTKPDDAPKKTKAVATKSDSSSGSDSDSSASDSDSSASDPQATPAPPPGAPPAQSAPGISGPFVITEDTSKFSPGASDAADPFGCANRRVPAEIDFAREGSDRIAATFPEEPDLPPTAHDGTLDAQNHFEIDYPDANGIEIEGRFELFGSETDLLDGHLFSGDCTFFFTGVRKG